MLLLTVFRRLLDAISTILLVTAIAAMVWLFAEQQNVHDQTPLTVELTYGTPEEQKSFLIGPPSPAPTKITMTFQCNNSQIDQVRKKFQSNGPYPIPLGLVSRLAGKSAQVPFEINLKEKIQQALAAEHWAVSNLKVEPDQSVTLNGEKVEEITLPVQLSHDTLVFVEPPKPSVNEITLQVPVSMAKIWRNTPETPVDTLTKAKLNLDKLALGDIKPGEEITRLVPIEIPAITGYLESNACLPEHKAYLKRLITTPPTVAVTMKLDKNSTEEFKLDALPVTIVPFPGSDNKWAFEFADQNDKYLNDLRLTAPPELGDRVEKNMKDETATKLVWVVARIPKPPTDNNKSMLLEVEVIRPAGVDLAPGTLLKKIEVRAIRRNSP